ncbi:hypothetical protein [Terasakiella sp. SH-1]|uniref:hypothetical protein n=1 Tax=Terasakiella sp. SH-1 TaxID=2560057 RepID=UPI0010732505|nr:hypothetical protein [Terasakiella sp. SH-1]
MEDWQRERLTEIPEDELTVSICFDMDQHSQKQVYELAHEECVRRITETQNLVQIGNLGNVRYLNQAEGGHFAGPVDRKKRIEAMVSSLQLVYTENDKWECPLATPNRITFECRYNVNAKDSNNRRQVDVKTAPSADLPPELPADLKPN